MRERVTGRLTTTSGQPISGALLDVFQTPAYEGAKTVQLAGVRTGPAGAWTLALPPGACSSTLRFAYRSHVDDTIPVATATLTLRVHAGIALRIGPRVASVGASMRAIASGCPARRPTGSVCSRRTRLISRSSAGFRTSWWYASGEWRGPRPSYACLGLDIYKWLSYGVA